MNHWDREMDHRELGGVLQRNIVSRPGEAESVHAVIWLFLLMVYLPPALGQSAVTPPKLPNQPKIPVLQLVKITAIANGQIGAIKGTVDGEGLKFTVPSLSILQPVIIMLMADNAKDNLKLTLYKKNWKEPNRTGSTGSSGRVDFNFRTEGAVNILVQSTGPMRPFHLAVWAGDELHPPMKDVIVTPVEYERLTGKSYTTNGGSSRLKRMIEVGLGIIAVGFVIFLFRRRGGHV